MADLSLTERVLSYMARQRNWLQRELDQAEQLLSDPAQLVSLDESLAAAKGATRELENLEREQRGLLAEWQASSIDPEAREQVLAQAAEIASLAAQLGIARGKVAQAIAEAQLTITTEQQGLRAGKMRVRRYAPADEVTGMNFDATRPGISPSPHRGVGRGEGGARNNDR